MSEFPHLANETVEGNLGEALADDASLPTGLQRLVSLLHVAVLLLQEPPEPSWTAGYSTGLKAM